MRSRGRKIKWKKLKDYLNEYGEYNIKNEEELLKLLERPKLKTVYDLQKGDKYYFLNSTGDIIEAEWDDHSLDYRRRASHRCYLTEQDAAFIREQEDIIAEMEYLGGTRNMMSLGDDSIIKYFIRFNHVTKVLGITGFSNLHYTSNIYFATYEQAQKVIDKIGEDRIKKYLFYVKE